MIRRLIVQSLTLVALGCSLLSCGMLWFAIPVNAGPLSVSPDTIHIAEPGITVAFRVATVVVVASMVILWAIGKAGAGGLVVASLWLAVLLTYPYLVMVWDSSIAGDAAWLESQHRNLVWSGGDLNMSTGNRAEGALDDLFLTQTPRSVNPIEVSEWQLSESALARLPDLVDRLGYSNKFFEFIRLGWIAALAGSVLLLIAISAPEGYLNLGRALRMVGIFTATMVVLCVLGWGWSFLVAAELASAAQHTARGEYQAALEAMQRAKRKMPALGEDTFFTAQTGLLEDALGRVTPAARLYRANLDERAGKLYRGDVTYEQLVTDTATPAPVRREACRALLRSAIDALNAGRANAAAELLEKVLAVEPCNLKANYALQLAYLRTGRYKAVPQLAQRVDAVYHYFQFPSKRAVVSASYQNALVADSALGNTEAAVGHVRKVVHP